MEKFIRAGLVPSAPSRSLSHQTVKPHENLDVNRKKPINY